MTHSLLAFAIGLWLAAFGFLRAAESEDSSIKAYESYVKERTATSWLVILGAERDFRSVKDDAQRLSRLSGMRFSMNGTVFDERLGLISADGSDYFGRRYNKAIFEPGTYAWTPYISVERSDAYPGLQTGYYIILEGIYGSRREAEARVRKFKPLAPDAYSARTQIYMGCIH